MLLTKKYLKKYQENMRVTINDELAREVLKIYGTTIIDTEGIEREFTEQDICEQLRKIIPKKKYIIEFDKDGSPL